MPVKDNQKNLKDDIQSLHLEQRPVEFETFDKGHGRLENRRIRTSSELNNYVDFPKVKQVFLIEREVEEIKPKLRHIRLTNINDVDEYKNHVLKKNEILLIMHNTEHYELGFQNQKGEYESVAVNVSDEAFADGIAKINDKSFAGTLTKKHAITQYIEKIIKSLGGQTHYKKTYTEYAYGITSLDATQASPENILEYNRGHWGIENREHYVRDKTFDEDRSQIRTKNGPRMMASLRNFAITICRLLGFKNIAKATRDFAKNPPLAMKAIGI
jgi:predicted transposase YbfD/YdcC